MQGNNMNELHIEYMPVEQLQHYCKNSKIHTKEQIQHISNSIKEFGFNDPIGIAGTDNIVLEGNGRIEAAKLLGIKMLPCIRLDHLTKEEQEAYVIAHNALNLETGFDDGVLFEEMKRLQSFDFTDFGINPEKFLQSFVRVQKRILYPVTKVHYLISADVNLNNIVLDAIGSLKNIAGIEIESTTN